MIVDPSDPLAYTQIGMECLNHAGMHRDKPTLVELGLADMQHAAGQQIPKSQVQCLGDTQAGRSEQSQKHHIDIPPERARLLTPQVAAASSMRANSSGV